MLHKGMFFAILFFLFSSFFSLSCAQEKYEFELYHHYTGRMKDILVEHVNAFTKEHSHVTINILYKAWNDIEEELMASDSMQARHFRDIYIIPHDRIGQLVENRIIRDVDPYMRRHEKRYLPLVQKAMQYEGKFYGYPIGGESLALFYNADILDRAPDDVDTLLDMRSSYQNPARDRYVMLFPIHNSYFTLPWMLAYGGSLFDEQGFPKLNTEANVAALQKVRALFRDKLKLPYREDLNCLGAFQDGNIPCVITGPWNISGMKEAEETLNFKIATLPKIDGEPVATFVGVQCMVVNRHIKDKGLEELEKLFTYLREKHYSRALSLDTKFVSPLLEDHKHPKIMADDEISALNRQVRSGTPMNNTPRMASIWQAFNPSVLKKILSGKVEIKALLDSLQKEIDKKRKK